VSRGITFNIKAYNEIYFLCIRRRLLREVEINTLDWSEIKDIIVGRFSKNEVKTKHIFKLLSS